MAESSDGGGHRQRGRVPAFFLRKLFTWKSCSRPPERTRRLVQPNHLVPEETLPKQHPSYGFAGNQVRTTKYTLLSFLPKNLFEQFHRFANLYFLFIVLLNWVPEVNAFGKEISMIPVVFVLAVTALKDAFEDRRRYLSDKRVNNSTCRIYCKKTGRYIKKLWKDVIVGDIIHLSCNEVIPADILLLRSSDELGLCYIETANLDGESNLKQRQIVKGHLTMQNTFQPTSFVSTIECDPPNNKIYRFHGSIIQSCGDRVPVTKENLLLRDCIVKNTDFVEGIVIYAGHETKAMLNNGGPRYKRSRVEKLMNRDIIWCIAILVVLCVTGAIGSGLWLGSWGSANITQIPYLSNGQTFSPSLEGFIVFWTFVIILQVMIPLSLYVTIEIIKLGQVFHIHEDVDLYDPKSNKRVECRALNIPEELGQVEYIFSDKTGTLTENNMIFRQCTIGGVDYHHQPHVAEGESARVKKKEQSAPTFVMNTKLQNELSKMEIQLHHSGEKSGRRSFSSQLSQENQRIQDFFLLLAVCNTVVVSKTPHKDQMNSSGLYLDCSINTLSSTSSSPAMARLPDNANDRYVRLINSIDTPPSSAGSTPTKRPHFLAIPRFGGRPATPSPSPSPKELRPFYEAESPDEIALVEAAFKYNCRLVRRTPESVVLSLPGEGLIEFKVLHILPFDSVRKRMSIILQNPFTEERILFCKGADSTILPNLAATSDQEIQRMISKTQNHLNNYSRRGLRILCMAKRTLSLEEYEMWALLHKEADLALDDKERRLYESACRIETQMDLLGATGIEDRLQDGVPETIASLRAAGIVIWVLTGDKQETAVNIAYSCRLFTMDMELITINARSRDAAEETLKFYLDQIEKDASMDADSYSMMQSGNPFVHFVFGQSGLARQKSQRRSRRALVIDGHTLAYVLERNLDKLFLQLAQSCSSVLCCRATPLQKSSVVKVVKDRLKVLTLAIGDGANDVSMIQTADVGVGISGQEGMQAVMASDFALARFKYLERLLLVHGHWCYDRLARIILYFFYKNASFIFVIFWYQYFCGFSAMVMMDQLYLMLFNVLFTSLPPLAVGIYDQNLHDFILQKQPNLYAQSRKSEIYTKYSFWVNMLDALYQSVVIYFIPHLAYEDSDVGIWEFGTTIYTICIVVQLLHISIETYSWTILHVLAIIFSLGVYFGFAVVYNMLSVGTHGLVNPYWVIQHLTNTGCFWFCIIVASVLACIPRFTIRALQNTVAPSEIVQALLDYKESQKSPDKAVVSISWSRGSSLVIRTRDRTNRSPSIPTISATVEPTTVA